MDYTEYVHGPVKLGATGWKIVESIAFALILLIAMPVHAGDARAVKTRVQPVYPEIAKRMHLSGVVKLEAAVDSQGMVTEVKELSGNHTLAEAAKEALLHWKFAPASSETNETISIAFNLGQE